MSLLSSPLITTLPNPSSHHLKHESGCAMLLTPPSIAHPLSLNTSQIPLHLETSPEFPSLSLSPIPCGEGTSPLFSQRALYTPDLELSSWWVYLLVCELLMNLFIPRALHGAQGVGSAQQCLLNRCVERLLCVRHFWALDKER